MTKISERLVLGTLKDRGHNSEVGNSRMAILARRIKNIKEGQTLLRMENWRTYRKVLAKHKKKLRQHWE
ncbi:hypothetical protein J6590_014155 [Homalodisca vitripennis]|nr:hypothetical protein J6590_014155 [Homalodisca vitripennis]